MLKENSKNNFFNTRNFPRFVFYLSLFTPFLLFIYFFGVSFDSTILYVLMMASSVFSIILGSISLIRVYKKKVSGGVAYSVLSILLGVVSSIILFLGFMIAMQYL